jgi:hypothetical protein
VYGASADAGRRYTDVDWSARRPRPRLGGIGPARVADTCDELVSIPSPADRPLNASVAAAVILFEARRARRSGRERLGIAEPLGERDQLVEDFGIAVAELGVGEAPSR